MRCLPVGLQLYLELPVISCGVRRDAMHGYETQCHQNSPEVVPESFIDNVAAPLHWLP